MKFLEEVVSKYQNGAKYFIPNDITITKLNGQMYGVGQVEYSEGSIYTGDIFFDGNHFNKIGNGEQNFLNSVIDTDATGGPIGSKLYLYVGEFDYRKTDWIYGNGVLYFIDEETLKPLCFVKGFFQGLGLIGDYQGEFDYSILKEGFTKDMEIFTLVPHTRLINNIKLNYPSNKIYDYLFVGDSWFEMWTWPYENGKIKNLFQEDFGSYNAANIGIGGSTYNDWNNIYKDLLSLYKAKKIIVNLGFNDLHSQTGIEETYKNMLLFIEHLLSNNPTADIYINSITHTNNFPLFLDQEEALNNKVKKYCSTQKNIHYSIVNTPFLVNGKPRNDLNDFCIDDLVHLNYQGYLLWIKEIKNNIFKRN